jgi:tripartite motif-containing protein 71
MSKPKMQVLAGLLLLVCSIPVSAGSLYVSDGSLFTVQVFNSTTGALTNSITLPGSGSAPSGIAVASDGSVYVADQANSVVDHFTAGGTFLSTFISSGLFAPTGMAFGPDGYLYVANQGVGNNSYISRFDSSGNPVDGTPFVPASTGLFDPGAIAFGPDGNLYIADSGNGAVDKVIRTTAAFSTLIPAGCPSTPFSIPEGVAFSNVSLYVSDEGSGCGGGGGPFGVYKYDTSGNLQSTFVATNVLSTPVDLAFGPNGNLFVTDGTPRVAEFDGTTGAYLTDFVPNGGSGGPVQDPTFLAFSSSAIPEPATFGFMALGLAGLLIRRRRK